MATTPTSISGSARGITRTLAGYVIQSETITVSPIAEQVPDQTGAIADEQIYDHRHDLDISCISASSAATAPATTGDNISYGGNTWRVDSVADAGTYNAVRKWAIKAHRYDNFPEQA